MPEPNVNSYKDTFLQKICDTTDAEIQNMLVRSAYGYKHMTPTQYWASTVLKDSFYREEDEFDQRSWNLLDDDEQAFTVTVNHRSDGKSMRSKAKISRGICFRIAEMIMYLQASNEDAANEMDEVKTTIMSNDFITEVFGRMKATSYEDVRKQFGKRAWYACNPEHPMIPKREWGEPFCFIYPRGCLQGQRGKGVMIRGRRVRPPWIFGDDVETDDLVLNSENRDKLKNWWFGAVMRSLPQTIFPDANTFRWKRPKDADFMWTPPYRVQVNGTILHHDGLMATLLGSSDWKGVRNPIGEAVVQPDKTIKYFTLRPTMISSEQLTAQAAAEKARGTLDVFYREMLCEPMAREHVCWTKDLFQYITLEEDAEIQNSQDWIRVLIVDPSKSASQQADLTGIISGAINPKTNRIVTRRAVSEHLNSNMVPDRALDIAVESNAQIVFVEIIGQRGVTDINFMNAITKRGLNVELRYLEQGHTPRGDYGNGNDGIKRWRGQQILPYYQDKEVWHHPSLRGSTLEKFMLDFPLPADWCLTDCSGYYPAVMHELGIVFMKTKKYENIKPFATPNNWDKIGRDIQERKWARV